MTLVSVVGNEEAEIRVQ